MVMGSRKCAYSRIFLANRKKRENDIQRLKLRNQYKRAGYEYEYVPFEFF